MTLTEQVFAQAQVLSGELEERQYALLRVLCQGAVGSLTARLREGLTPEDCKADFLAAASLLALSALAGIGDGEDMEQIAIGDMTLRPRAGDAASRCLYNQAQFIIAPYLGDSFSFLGV